MLAKIDAEIAATRSALARAAEQLQAKIKQLEADAMAVRTAMGVLDRYERGASSHIEDHVPHLALLHSIIHSGFTDFSWRDIEQWLHANGLRDLLEEYPDQKLNEAIRYLARYGALVPVLEAKPGPTGYPARYALIPSLTQSIEVPVRATYFREPHLEAKPVKGK